VEGVTGSGNYDGGKSTSGKRTLPMLPEGHRKVMRKLGYKDK